MATKKKRTVKKAVKKKPPNYDKLYFGKAGHLFVMSELLLQKWNVAMPEVDIGDDIFVVRDRDGYFIKVQVKSANTKSNNGVERATVTTSFKQLRGSADGKLIYFFLIRKNNKWDKVLIIERTELWDLYGKVTPSARTKSRNPSTITIGMNYLATGIIKWKGESMEQFHENWKYFDHNAPKSN